MAVSVEYTTTTDLQLEQTKSTAHDISTMLKGRTNTASPSSLPSPHLRTVQSLPIYQLTGPLKYDTSSACIIHTSTVLPHAEVKAEENALQHAAGCKSRQVARVAADKYTCPGLPCAPGHIRVDEALPLLGEQQNGVADPQRALHLLVNRLQNATHGHINGAASLHPNRRRRPGP